jgi:uncharacterized protein YoxC
MTFFIIILVVGGIFGGRFLLKEMEAENARRAREAEQQREYERRLHSACNESLVAFENIPKNLMSAEQLLDTAENEFQDSAFSPFWDSIERAMQRLGAVDGGIKLITDHSNKYKTIAKSYKGKPPAFPIDPDSAQRLETVSATAGRMQKVVRQAQRNFQFATIYEQRKTSEILIAGFTNLGEAIHGLGTRLEESIDMLGDQIHDLSSSMTEMNEKVVEAVKGVSFGIGEMSSRIDDVSSAVRDEDKNTQGAMTAQADRQEKANRMLDNIQRRRVPPPLAEH